MELPVHSSSALLIRRTADVRAMALAVQANLVQLTVAEAKSRGIGRSEHAIKVASPGPVRQFRETLVDRKFLSEAPDEHVHLRLREVWGQFCLMRWLLSVSGPDEPCSFVDLPVDTEIRCGAALIVKHAEVHATLWRMRFEQRKRHDAGYARSPRFEQDRKLAERIPASALGKSLDACTDEELLLASCEHAGMLAVLRWVMDCRRTWGEPGIMDVGNKPF